MKKYTVEADLQIDFKWLNIQHYGCSWYLKTNFEKSVVKSKLIFSLVDLKMTTNEVLIYLLLYL
jgi:hypothetical protein